MKRILAIVLILTAVVTTASADACRAGHGHACRAGHGHLYPTTFVVVNVDYINDELTLKDACGNLWKVIGVEDYFVGDGVSAIMFDNDTERVEDDQIVEMTYTCLSNLAD